MQTVTFVCADSCKMPRLTVNKAYPVVGMALDHYRVIDDEDEPILYPKRWFKPRDLAPPSSWEIVTDEEDGTFYADPPGIAEQGFYEKYFDGDAATITRFREYIQSQSS